MAALPPGPGLPAAAQTLLYHRDPLGVLVRARARYGAVFTLRVPKPVVFVADPAAVGPLLRSDGEWAHAGSARRTILPLASPESPFGADGEQHRAIRAVMEPALAPAAIAEDMIATIAADHVAQWPTGVPFRLLPRMRTLATDIFVRVVLRIEQPGRRAALVAAIRRMLRTPGNPPLPVPGDAATRRVFQWRMAPVAGLLEEEIAARRFLGDDLLGRVAAVTANPVDRLLVVIAAAQEPPSIALTNVVYELARAPGLQDRVLEDPASLDAIASEAMRLRPSAAAALRRLIADADVAGHPLSAGTTVALPSALLHRDPRAYPEPNTFRSERFAGGEPAGMPYFPFGGGARRCIGEPLARAELRTVVPVVLERLRVRAVWPRPERMVVRGTVLVPHRSAVLRTAPRGA